MTRTIQTVFNEKADGVINGQNVMGFAQAKQTFLNAGIIGPSNTQIKLSNVQRIWSNMSKVDGTHIKCSQYENELIPRIGEVNILNQTSEIFNWINLDILINKFLNKKILYSW